MKKMTVKLRAKPDSELVYLKVSAMVILCLLQMLQSYIFFHSMALCCILAGSEAPSPSNDHQH